jgi:hypothetical protein
MLAGPLPANFDAGWLRAKHAETVDVIDSWRGPIPAALSACPRPTVADISAGLACYSATTTATKPPRKRQST